MTSIPRFAPAIGLFIIAAIFPRPSSSDCITDQEQALGSSFVLTVGEQNGEIHRVAQTFQVGADGVLAEIHVRGSVSVEPAGDGPLVVQIFPTAGGVPDESAGALLTEVVAFSELPYGVFPPPEVVIDVSDATLPVVTGQVLALVLSNESGAFLWVVRPSAPYPDGTAWSRENADPTWTDQAMDLSFRTIVCSVSVSAEEVVSASSWGRTKTTFRGE